MKIKLTVNHQALYATLQDNVTVQQWVKQFPMSLTMKDLYNREMCYRYGLNSFDTEHVVYANYQVGDIVYWPPLGSLVILYAQNGERFDYQYLGHIDEGVELFEITGDCVVTFEVAEA